ncbi:hypothetical protein ACFXAR_04950, partial [Streptomyces rubiginosohelvolus]
HPPARAPPPLSRPRAARAGGDPPEVGEYRSFELGGPHPYAWQQAPTLQFTVAVTGEGAKGRTRDEIDDLVVQAQAALPARLESAVEKQN